jgi:hypothetical protein
MAGQPDAAVLILAQQARQGALAAVLVQKCEAAH